MEILPLLLLEFLIPYLFIGNCLFDILHQVIANNKHEVEDDTPSSTAVLHTENKDQTDNLVNEFTARLRENSSPTQELVMS